MKAADIAGRLAVTRFHFRRFLLVSNVSWGLLPWEADLIAMSGSGYLSEIEIKISIADLKRDKLKRKWLLWGDSYHAMIKARWFAMPDAVWAHKDAAAQIPEGAGVITIHAPLHKWDNGVTIEREPVENGAARPLNQSERFQLARLQAMRHWSKLAREARKAAA